MYIAGILLMFTLAVLIYALFHNSKFNSGKSTTNPFKTVIRTVAIISIIFGFSYTMKIPKKEFGVSFYQLGCMAEGQMIDDSKAMCKYLNISTDSSVKEIKQELNNMKTQAREDFQDCLIFACGYWVCSAILLFIRIDPNYEKTAKDKESEKNNS